MIAHIGDTGQVSIDAKEKAFSWNGMETRE
jgi:hypothetical protein